LLLLALLLGPIEKERKDENIEMMRKTSLLLDHIEKKEKTERTDEKHREQTGMSVCVCLCVYLFVLYCLYFLLPCPEGINHTE